MNKIYTLIMIALLIYTNADKCYAQWTIAYQDNNAQFYDAAFPTDNIGYVAASDTGGAFVLRTANGGMAWNKKYITGWGFINKVVMIDSMKGYLMKGGAPVQILKTLDGFATYTTHNLDSSFVVQSLCLLNDSTGFYLNNATRLRKFEHNGASFSHIIDTLNNGQNLQFINSGTGYLDTGNGLLMTSDTGVSWNFINNNLGFSCIVFNFADSLNGFFSDGSKIYKTSDGAITFPQQYNFPNVYCLAVKGSFCMGVNDTGNVAYTTNNGQTWQTETTGMNVVAPGPHKVICSPGGQCFLFSDFGGEIRKREAIISGIYPVMKNDAVSIYPNPFSGEFTVTNTSNEFSTFILYDITSRKILEKNFINSASVSMNQFPDGIYMYEMYNKKGLIRTGKLIKN